jgi:hypothetical protein
LLTALRLFLTSTPLGTFTLTTLDRGGFVTSVTLNFGVPVRRR